MLIEHCVRRLGDQVPGVQQFEAELQSLIIATQGRTQQGQATPGRSTPLRAGCVAAVDHCHPGQDLHCPYSWLVEQGFVPLLSTELVLSLLLPGHCCAHDLAAHYTWRGLVHGREE